MRLCDAWNIVNFKNGMKKMCDVFKYLTHYIYDLQVI